MRESRSASSFRLMFGSVIPTSPPADVECNGDKVLHYSCAYLYAALNTLRYAFCYFEHSTCDERKPFGFKLHIRHSSSRARGPAVKWPRVKGDVSRAAGQPSPLCTTHLRIPANCLPLPGLWVS